MTTDNIVTLHICEIDTDTYGSWNTEKPSNAVILLYISFI